MYYNESCMYGNKMYKNKINLYNLILISILNYINKWKDYLLQKKEN